MASYYYPNNPQNQSIPMNADQRSREASTTIAHGGSHIPGGNRTANRSQSIAHGGNHIPGGNRTASDSQNGAGYMPDGSRTASGRGAGYMPDRNRTASESQNIAHGGSHIPGRYNTAGERHGGNHIPGGNRGSGYQGAGAATMQQQLPNNPPVTYPGTRSSYTPNPTGQYNVGTHGGRHSPGSLSQQQPSNYFNQASQSASAQGSQSDASYSQNSQVQARSSIGASLRGFLSRQER